MMSFRPRIEVLEDRIQPSLAPLPLEGLEAHPIADFKPLKGVGTRSTGAPGVHPMIMFNTATYITGTTGSATARGTALGPDGSSYETGTITQGGSEEAYVAKYDPNGKQVYLFPFQLEDNTNHSLNTEGQALAVDIAGNAYVTGTVFDAASIKHGYAAKISADGTRLLWMGSFSDPSTGDGIAVYDPNNNGAGQAVVAGTLTVTDATLGPLGDHVFAARTSADGASLDYEFFYTFGTDDGGSHGHAIALNSHSTRSTPGSLAYVAGDFIFAGRQQTLAVQIDNGNGPSAGGLIWSRTLANSGNAPNVDTLTGVAVNPDDSSVYSGTAASSGFATMGIVLGYPADGGPLNQQPPIVGGLLNLARSLNAIAVDSAGNMYVTGAAADPRGLGNIFLAALDNKGQLLSDLQFGGFGTVDQGYGVVVANSGLLWVVGDTTSALLSTDGTTLKGTQDGWLAAITIP